MPHFYGPIYFSYVCFARPCDVNHGLSFLLTSEILIKGNACLYHKDVYSTVYSDADQRKHQSSALLAFVWGIHRGPVNSPHKWPVTRKMFPFDYVIMDKSFIWIININTFLHLTMIKSRRVLNIRVIIYSTYTLLLLILRYFVSFISFLSSY